MDMAQEKVIDLAGYGMEGEIVMGPQTLRSRVKMKNEISRRTLQMGKDENGNISPEPKDIDAGDMELIQILSYVRKAPFTTTLEAFLDYCDKIEETQPGKSLLLEETMQSAVEEIIADPSPLDG